MGNSHWGLISSKVAGFVSRVLVEVDSLVCVSQVFCLFYCVNGCLGGITLGDCFIILSTLFILILHGRKVFWEALFAGEFLINKWFCVSFRAIQKKRGTGGGNGCGGEGNNSIDMMSFFDFHQSSVKSNNLKDIILFYDFISRRFHHISRNHD